jgi:hypothetical protein
LRATPRRGLRTVALAAAVTVLAALAAAVPATAEPSDPRRTQRPTPPAATDHSKPQRLTPEQQRRIPGASNRSRAESAGCNLTESEKQQRIARGKPNTICVRRLTAPPSIPSNGMGRSARMDPYNYTANVPQWCQDAPFYPDDWYIKRKEICSYGLFELTVRNTQSQAIVFDGVFSWGANSFSDASVLNYYDGMNVRLEGYSGTLAGLTMDSYAECETQWDGSCAQLEYHGFDAFQVLYQHEHESYGYWHNNLPETVNANEPENWVWNGTFVVLQYPNADSETLEFGNVYYNCDNLMPQPSYPGCVMRWYDPVAEYSAAEFSEFTAHLESARYQGFPGFEADPVLCPETFNQCGVALSRLTDQSLKALNYQTACPSSIPRPPGKQCDEYPPQSSYEGAYTSGGTNWDYMIIDATQNMYAGTLLGAFFGDNRVIRWDRFFFKVLP